MPVSIRLPRCPSASNDLRDCQYCAKTRLQPKPPDTKLRKTGRLGDPFLSAVTRCPEALAFGWGNLPQKLWLWQFTQKMVLLFSAWKCQNCLLLADALDPGCIWSARACSMHLNQDEASLSDSWSKGQMARCRIGRVRCARRLVRCWSDVQNFGDLVHLSLCCFCFDKFIHSGLE